MVCVCARAHIHGLEGCSLYPLCGRFAFYLSRSSDRLIRVDGVEKFQLSHSALSSISVYCFRCKVLLTRSLSERIQLIRLPKIEVYGFFCVCRM